MSPLTPIASVPPAHLVADADLIACPSCDALYHVQVPPKGGRAVCARCKTVLIRPRHKAGLRIIALTLSVTILVIAAVFFPFLEIHTTGLGNRASILRTVSSAGDERVYRTITESVLSQRLVPGTKLPEMPLASLFGVSRAVVRRALQRLENDHLVELRPNRGAIVAMPTPEETRTIFEARRVLERSVVELVTHTATSEARSGGKILTVILSASSSTPASASILRPLARVNLR